MTHPNQEHFYQIRYRWQKEQQLIRKKYHIPYNMTSTSTRCFEQSISNTLQAKYLLHHNKIILTDNEPTTKSLGLDKPRSNIRSNIPPMYCSKCHLYLSECSCTDGLGQWWMNLHKHSYSTDKISKQSSINSIHERHVNFESSQTDSVSSHRKDAQKSNYNPQQYVLLNWNNRQSLLEFLRTITLNQHLSTMTIEQLHALITNNDHIHIFHSIIKLILSLSQNQLHENVCQIYIDPSYYSTVQGMIPFSQSQLIADNINLNRTLHSIQTIARRLGVQIDPFQPEKASRKQRKLILHEQALFIASKIPYTTFRLTSTRSQ